MFGYANSLKFEKLSKVLIALLGTASLILFPLGLYYGLFASPADYQQSETVRIMYVHVPAAWTALFCYASMAVAGLTHIIWRHTVAGLYIRAACGLGAGFTAVCLITGSLWGAKMWGTWWVWDARLTSVLILFFLYLGIIALKDAFDHPERGVTACAWLSVIGAVNLPIIKFSVDWWNTLHQPASLTSPSRMMDPAMTADFLTPLLIMGTAYMTLFGCLVLIRTRNEIQKRKALIKRTRVGNAHGLA